MSQSKEGGTAAAAAEQLGAMSRGESVETKENETENNEDAAEENGTSTKMCSACGKKSDTAKKCTACKCVSYCDKECQNKHWKEHKKECKRIKKILGKRGGKLDLGTEKDLGGPLPDLPPREECPICMQVLPIHENLHAYFPCCGKAICCGCDHQHLIKCGNGRTCAFCRMESAKSDEEILARALKRVERNDPRALLNTAMSYGYGELGPVSYTHLRAHET